MRFELRRKLFHFCVGVCAIILLDMNLVNFYILAAIFAVGCLLSYLSTKMEIPVVSWLLRTFDRQEKIPGKGALAYIFGICLVVLLFPEPDVRYASIMILSLGDAAAALVGKGWKKTGRRHTRHPLSNDKILEGTLAGIIAASLGAMLFVPLGAAIAASTAAMIVEGIEHRYSIDDNISIPLVAGLVLVLL